MTSAPRATWLPRSGNATHRLFARGRPAEGERPFGKSGGGQDVRGGAPAPLSRTEQLAQQLRLQVAPLEFGDTLAVANQRRGAPSGVTIAAGGDRVDQFGQRRVPAPSEHRLRAVA